MRQILTQIPTSTQVTVRGQRGVVNGVEGARIAYRLDLLDADLFRLQHEMFGERLRAASPASASPSLAAAGSDAAATGATDAWSHAGLMPAMGRTDAQPATRRTAPATMASKSPSKPEANPPAAIWAALVLSRAQCG